MGCFSRRYVLFHDQDRASQSVLLIEANALLTPIVDAATPTTGWKYHLKTKTNSSDIGSGIGEGSKGSYLGNETERHLPSRGLERGWQALAF
jgi:hypothetical protein